ncbi:hypothetical protein ACJX0J_019344, partial [Zea mays]
NYTVKKVFFGGRKPGQRQQNNQGENASLKKIVIILTITVFIVEPENCCFNIISKIRNRIITTIQMINHVWLIIY